MKLYMFRTVRLSVIRSLFTVHSAMVHVIQACRQLSSRSVCWTEHVHKLFVGLIRRTACARAQFSESSSATDAHSETRQMAVCCKNLPLGVLRSRSAPYVPVGALFKKFGLFLNIGVSNSISHLLSAYSWTKFIIFPHIRRTMAKIN